MQTIELDRVDLRLLELLQRDASQSNLGLAEAAHISPATCLRRVKRLEQQGVIERRVALLSSEKLGHGLTAIIEITLDAQGAEHQQAFAERCAAEGAVQQCYRVSSGPDFVLVVWCADMAGYHALTHRLFTQNANVRQVKTYFSVQRVKFEPGIGLPAPSA